MDLDKSNSQDLSRKLFQTAKFSITFVVLIWMIHIIQVVFTFDLGYLGIRPRAVYGLKGIFFAPLIHGDFQHLISNSAPILFLMTLLNLAYPKVTIRVFTMIYILTGLAVWLFARPVFHIGASGVVYGLVSFIFWTGIFRRNVKSIALSLIIIFLYSGIIMGILPGQEGISWESHLLGGLVGIFTAYWYKEETEEKPNPQLNTYDPPQAGRYFFPQDTFNYTKQERQTRNQIPPSDLF